jgi:hypothetical protein
VRADGQGDIVNEFGPAIWQQLATCIFKQFHQLMIQGQNFALTSCKDIVLTLHLLYCSLYITYRTLASTCGRLVVAPNGPGIGLMV